MLTSCISVIIIIMQKLMQELHSMIKSLELTGRLIYQKLLFQRKTETFLHSKNLKKIMILSMGKCNYNIIFEYLLFLMKICVVIHSLKKFIFYSFRNNFTLSAIQINLQWNIGMLKCNKVNARY